MVVIEGLCFKDQRALVALLEAVIALPRLEAETVRRAQYLKWHLEGYDPLAFANAMWAQAQRGRLPAGVGRNT